MSAAGAAGDADGAAARRGLLGVLMLETRFPRIVGDVGNPATFGGAVRYRVVAGASPRRVVHQRDVALLAPFVAAGEELVRAGVAAITTSCGFLVLFQDELQCALPVPVWTSSLLLLAPVERALPPGRVAGVVTVDAAALGPEHLRRAGARPDTPVAGLEPGCAFQRTLLDDLPELDVADARAATVAAARRLVAQHPEVGAIILECTNMPPYAHAVRAATGRPVYDLTSLVAQHLTTEDKS